MPNLVRIYVEDPDALLVGYEAGAVVQVQSCATETGVFADETTLALVSGTKSYTYWDADGASTTWYRVRYENAGGTVTSDWYPAFQTAGEEAGYLCSLEDVKQRLGIASSSTTDDEDLAEIIRQVSDEILGYTGREFVGTPGDVTRTFDVPVTSAVLYIPGGIRSVTTLSLATSDQTDTGGTYTATTSYYLRPLAHERTSGWPATRIEAGSGTYFYAGRSTVQITGKFGWSQVPPAITRIAATACVSHFMTKGAEGPRAAVGPDGRMFILRDISPADMAILASYREPFV